MGVPKYIKNYPAEKPKPSSSIHSIDESELEKIMQNVQKIERLLKNHPQMAKKAASLLSIWLEAKKGKKN
jgi:hypothetical protein